MSAIIPQHVHFFSPNLKYLLKRLGISQLELAMSISRKQTTVSNWINGNSVPDVDDLVKIHHYFGISTDVLIMIDMEKTGVITGKYVDIFALGNKRDKQAGKKGYEQQENTGNILREPEIVFNQTILGQLTIMDAKLDSIKQITQKLGEKRGKR